MSDWISHGTCTPYPLLAVAWRRRGLWHSRKRSNRSCVYRISKPPGRGSPISGLRVGVRAHERGDLTPGPPEEGLLV